ncbi:MAG: biopolymer transporter ExbD [Saprospiraceae bacterium]|nr:biopolymer transporter ExbD [Saprospiraceae bacterium]
MRKRRKMPELNAGSMADIAFLLLIFFLVVTTIAEDKGIPVILPEYYEGEPGPMAARNVLKILINGNDDVLVESILTEKDEIKDIVIDFVTNPNLDETKPLQTNKAIISIQNDVHTSYETYVQIYSNIHEAYAFLRNSMAHEIFQKEYAQLPVSEKNTVLEKYPLKLSEADPFLNATTTDL